jgi:tetratricopeptide (TPR) repeat protein
MPAPAPKVIDFITLLNDDSDQMTAHRAIRDVQEILRNGSPDQRERGFLLSALGIAYCNLGNEEKSLVNHRNAIHNDPSWHDHYTNYGVSLRRFGKKDEALDQHFKAASLPGGRSDLVAVANLASSLWDVGCFVDALSLLREAYDLLDVADFHRSMILARLAVMVGQNQMSLQVVARLAAAKYGIMFDIDHPEITIRAAPSEFKQAVFHWYPVAVAYLLAVEVEVAPVLACPAEQREVARPLPEDSATESAEFEATKNARQRATAEELTLAESSL